MCRKDHGPSNFGIRCRVIASLANLVPHGGFRPPNNQPFKTLTVRQFTNVPPINLLLWSVLEGYMVDSAVIDGSYDTCWIDLADLFIGNQTDNSSTVVYTEQ